MIPIREQFEVAASRDTVWPLLSDPAFVVTCVPGASLVADHGNGNYDGMLAVKFGPITASFRGVAKIAFDHAAKSCTIEARGQDGKGASRAGATAVVTTTDDNGRTCVMIDGNFNVTGPLGQFARTGGQHLAREMIAEFSRNFAARLNRSTTETGSADASAPLPASNELSAFKLIWRTLCGWFRSGARSSG